MKKILIAVDDTKGSKDIMSIFGNLVMPPEEVVLLHVQKPLGKSLMGDMLGEAEMSTLKESLEGTDAKEAMDRKAEAILAYYKKELEQSGLFRVRAIVRMGHPDEEILKVSEEEGVEMMILGCNGKRPLHKLITGCVTRDVEKRAGVPVLVAKAGGCRKHEQVWNEAYAS